MKDSKALFSSRSRSHEDTGPGPFKALSPPVPFPSLRTTGDRLPNESPKSTGRNWRASPRTYSPLIPIAVACVSVFVALSAVASGILSEAGHGSQQSPPPTTSVAHVRTLTNDPGKIPGIVDLARTPVDSGR